DHILQLRRCDVLTTCCDDDLLLAPGDREIARVIEMTDVAGDEPIAVEGCFRRRRILRIAGEHVDPTDEDLAVISDPNPYAGQGRPDRTDSGSADDVDARGSGGLGESVSFEDLDAEAAIEVTEA